MPNYVRNYVAGGTFFFTVVVYRRKPILESALARRVLREAIEEVRRKRPFEMFATCLLPDHLHTVWILPPGECDYSIRWKRIKEEFTERWMDAGGAEAHRSASRRSKQERGIWQRRFWEHTVRDEEDLKRCVDYTHWNPRKHQLVTRVRDWPHSSFHRFVELGDYDLDWGGLDPTEGWDAPEWGE